MFTFLCNIAFLVVFAVTACGGNLRPPDPVPSAFDGTWSGHVTVDIPPEIRREYDTMLDVDVAGALATVSGICPDGAEDIRMAGFDGTLAWEGSVTCNPSWVLGCAVRLEYTGATATITDEGQLLLHVTGNAHRAPITDMTCEGLAPFTLDFTGAQPNATTP